MFLGAKPVLPNKGNIPLVDFMRGVTKHNRQLSRYGGDQLPLLIVLIAIYVLGRILFIASITFPEDCKDIQPLMLGRDGAIDATVDTGLAVALAAAGLLIATLFNTVMTRRMKAVEIVLGCINTGIIALLICVWLTTWAFFHPWHSMSPVIYQVIPQQAQIYAIPQERDWSISAAPDWREIEDNLWVNQELNILTRIETVKTCWPSEFARRHLENRFPDGLLPDGRAIADLPTDALTHPERRLIYYDMDGNYITSSNPQDHYKYKSLRIRDAERDALRPGVDVQHLQRELQKSARLPRRKPLHTYSKEEINEMVAMAWEDD